MIFVGSLVCALVALPFLAEVLRPSMNAARRAQAPGKIAALPAGDTHYQWYGHERDPVIVCIHGLATPSYVFAATVRSLTSLGFRVLTYDLYGRGFSARARGAQDRGFFLAQLRGLLTHQNVTGPVTVLGFSMGGQIAAALAAEDDRVKRLILVAPAGLAKGESHHVLWTAPAIGDWMTRVLGGVQLRQELIEHKDTATVIPDFEDRQAAETKVRGYLPALLSSRRHMLNQSSVRDHTQVARFKTPVLAIWGKTDPVIPRSAMARLAQINPNAQHVEIKDAGHTLLQTHPSEIAIALRDFLCP